MKYKLVICGGTFDLLHSGHKSFLTQIFHVSEKVTIGLTSNVYTSKFKNQTSEDFKIRKKNLEDFLLSIGVKGRFEISPIEDIYGPLLDKNLRADALVVTPQTNRAAIGINNERKDLGLPAIKILIIKMDPAEDGELISSSRIRSGEINREGRLYVNPDWEGRNFILPESLRPELQKPFGKVLKSVPSGLSPDKTITIGDVATQRFNKNKIGQLLSIVDFAVKRERKFDKLSELGFSKRIETKIVKNPAGSVNFRLFEQIDSAFKKEERRVILVEGEEDLAVLPAILTAPLGFTIFYGQPDQGLVEVLVTEQVKEKAYNLLSKFKLS